VLHIALAHSARPADPRRRRPTSAQVNRVLAKLRDFTERLRGALEGPHRQGRITDCQHRLNRRPSSLGPLMVTEALRPY